MFYSLKKDKKDNYLEIYENYINNPIAHKKSERLILNLFNFQSHVASKWTENLYQIWIKRKKEINLYENYSNLKTNGSTNLIPTEYKWGPSFNIFKNKAWYFQHRFWKISNKYWIRIINSGKNEISSSKQGIKNEGIIFDLNINTFLKNKNNFDFLNSCWIIDPMSLNILIKNHEILNHIKKNEITVSLTECSSEAYDFLTLRDFGIPWTNQMRSWKEGTAFYTCPYGKKHWMENLFYCTEDKKIVDLFNLYNDWWMEEDANPDNIWPIEKEFKQCECGTWYREMNFQPHAIKSIITENKYISFYNNPRSMHLYSSYDLSFIKKYEYFQVVQQKDLKTFHIHINKNPSEKELEKIKNLINNLYESVNTNIIITHNKFKVGFNNKRPLFWSLYEGKINLRKKMKMDKFL